MTEYNLLGLENYIFNFMKNVTPKKNEQGWIVLEERYYKNLDDEILLNKVHSKILDKLADKIAENYIKDLFSEGVKE